MVASLRQLAAGAIPAGGLSGFELDFNRLRAVAQYGLHAGCAMHAAGYEFSVLPGDLYGHIAASADSSHIACEPRGGKSGQQVDLSCMTLHEQLDHARNRAEVAVNLKRRGKG